MSWSTPPPDFIPSCRRMGLEIDAALVARFGAYLEALQQANQSFNLTAVRDPDTAWMRHIADSLSLIPLLPEDASIIDVGSGAGLPGLVLALAAPDRSVTLLEATGKKCSFLSRVTDDLGLHRVRVRNARAEETGQDPECREAFGVAVARAVADLPVLLELCAPLVRVGGRVLALKGQSAAEEQARAAFAGEQLGLASPTRYVPRPDDQPDACVIEYTKVRPTPDRYPRRPGMPAKRPILAAQHT